MVWASNEIQRWSCKMASSITRKITATCAVLGLAAIGVAADPAEANAWWRNYNGYGYGVYVPPVVVAPPAAYYARPPVYYAPPARMWIPAHYENGYYIPGYWR
jgi:hypothetical protein